MILNASKFVPPSWCFSSIVMVFVSECQCKIPWWHSKLEILKRNREVEIHQIRFKKSSVKFQRFSNHSPLCNCFLEFRSLWMAITYMGISNQEVSDSIDLSQPLHTKVINHFLCECSVLVFIFLFIKVRFKVPEAKKNAQRKLSSSTKNQNLWGENIIGWTYWKKWQFRSCAGGKLSASQTCQMSPPPTLSLFVPRPSESRLEHLMCLGVPKGVDRTRSKSFTERPPKTCPNKKKQSLLSRTKHRKKTTTN